MDHTLNDSEVRVLGALIEKEITTPDYYPLSLNALVAACNQSSNRHPVVHYDESTVMQATDTLREKQLVHLITRGESRVNKYRHVLYESMNLGRQEIAVLCVLLLRGPQTVGEIRNRTNRLYDFSSVEQLEGTLNSMMGGESPLIVKLARQAGQKDVRRRQVLQIVQRHARAIDANGAIDAGRARRGELETVLAEARPVHLHQLNVDDDFRPRLVDGGDQFACRGNARV